MEALTLENAVLMAGTWLDPSIQSNEDVDRFIRSDRNASRRPLPEDSGKKVSLCRYILDALPVMSTKVVWLRDWGAFGSCEHMPLLVRLREALGERRQLIDTPAMRFDASERDDAMSLVLLSALFFWDCLLFNSETNSYAFISHDEYYVFSTSDRRLRLKVQAELERNY